MSTDRTRPAGDFTLDETDAATTIAACLRRRLPDRSWSEVRRLCESGKVRVDGVVATDPAARVRPGQTAGDRDERAAPARGRRRLPPRARRRARRGDREAVGRLQRPLRTQGDRHRDGPDPRRLAPRRPPRDRDAALRRAPHRQGHLGPAVLREDAARRARAAHDLPEARGDARVPGGRRGRRREPALRIVPGRRSRRRHPRVDAPPRPGAARGHPRHRRAAPARRHAVPRAPRDRTHAPDSHPPVRGRPPAGRRDGVHPRPLARRPPADDRRAADAARGDAGLRAPGHRRAARLPLRAAGRLHRYPAKAWRR